MISMRFCDLPRRRPLHLREFASASARWSAHSVGRSISERPIEIYRCFSAHYRRFPQNGNTNN